MLYYYTAWAVPCWGQQQTGGGAMGESYPRLVGDIGGTHARWAWLPRAGAPLQQVQVQPCARSASLLASARE